MEKTKEEMDKIRDERIRRLECSAKMNEENMKALVIGFKRLLNLVLDAADESLLALEGMKIKFRDADIVLNEEKEK